jgi:hypothetical protein
MLADLIDKCIAANPKKRFNSVQSLLLALRERDMAHARRPLMLLGLIGPLLLIVVMSLFGWGAFGQAAKRAEEAVLEKAKQSNQFAAVLAAQSSGEQIDEYYRAVAQLSRDDSFLKLFDDVMKDKELEKMRIELADPRQNSKEGIEKDESVGATRQSFKDHATRRALQQPLEDRMTDVHQEYPAAASWFVCDRFGNQIASVFEDPENLTLGNNYAYRSYFTGNDADLIEKEDAESLHVSGDFEMRKQQLSQAKPRKIIGERDDGKIDPYPKLSAVFPSEQSKTWKVAFSAPIVRDNEILGVVAVTVDLGNLIELATNVINDQTGDSISANGVQAQYVMLVDGRDNETSREGVILAHPLFKKVIARDSRLPDELGTVTVNESALSNRFFEDPVGKIPYVQENFGQNYGRKSIVTRIPVKFEKPEPSDADQKQPDSNGVAATSSRKETGLFVLAVQDYDIIFSDLQQLEWDLGKLAVLALLMLIGVTLAMWIFVNRMMKESRDRLARAFSPTDTAGSLVRENGKVLDLVTDSKFLTDRAPTQRKD